MKKTQQIKPKYCVVRHQEYTVALRTASPSSGRHTVQTVEMQ